MGYSFDEIGITAGDILAGIDGLRTGYHTARGRSKKVFLIDYRDGYLWDLKPVLRAAETISGKKLYPNFTSDRYRKDLSKAGFSYLVFKEARVRCLGVSGFDPEEVADEHDVFFADGRVGENCFEYPAALPLERCEQIPFGYEFKVGRFHQAWERRGVKSRKIKDHLGLICKGCGLDAVARFGHDNAMSCMDLHHVKPVAEMPVQGRSYHSEDFVVLCATCHRLIQKLKSPNDIEGLRNLVDCGV
ncbi:MAG: hypothetical protein ACU0BJ_03135 [Shimia sp.]|uniref:hypothetical protein n=1 Tax=Shimia sp. TaxID=1954381 RepID=UPI004059E420